MPAAMKVLVIDDDDSLRKGCAQTLSGEGYRVRDVGSGNEALEMVSGEAFDIFILDLKMPGMDGMEVLECLRESDPASVVIVITGYATVETAVEAMKLGAYDFLPKPFTPDGLLAIVDRAAERKRLGLENICLRRELDERAAHGGIVGTSSAINGILTLIDKVAASDSTVLITGETGVGKELVAREIHRRSARSAKPFVVVDCGALVETLFESELFGHVKGAFTGAVETKHGKFELADGGTMFLDEISNIETSIQAKLLRAIQEREIVKVGSSKKIDVDARIVAATNRDLENEIRENRFREDLYYRLKVFPLSVPPLRERKEDILVLAEHFLGRFGRKKGKHVTRISEEATRVLEAHDWPGNVRELENAIERAVVMADTDVITPGDLAHLGPVPESTDGPDTQGRLAQAEKEEIEKALERFEGHKSNAAEYLGINRKTLREKIRKYGISD